MFVPLMIGGVQLAYLLMATSFSPSAQTVSLWSSHLWVLRISRRCTDMTKRMLSKVGSIVSLFGLLFLPLVSGCGQTVNGLQTFTSQPTAPVLFLRVAIGCAIALWI